MEKIAIRLAILMLLLFTCCGRDLEQAKRYSEMQTDCDSLITQTNLIINEHKSIKNSLSIQRDAILKIPSQKYKLQELDRKILVTSEIVSNFESVNKHLQAIKKFAKDGEKATKSLIFYKRKYITYATVIQIHDENILIQEITDGLSTKQYISKYLIKEKQK